MNPTIKLQAGPWCGAVTPTSAVIKATVKARKNADAAKAKLKLAENEKLTQNVQLLAPTGEPWEDETLDYERYILTFRLSGLAANTPYHYQLVDGASQPLTPPCSFRTFPPDGQRAGFRFASASCDRGQLDETFRAIASEEDLLLFFHLGDLYYDIKDTKVGERLETYDKVLSRVGVQHLFGKVPVPYTWDDHDYLGNSSHGGTKGGPAAREAYRLYVPHYPLPDKDDGIYHSFSVGNVQFIVTDTRSRKSDPKLADTSAKTMLGAKQKQWLKDTLTAAKTRDLVFLVSSIPWLADAEAGKDHWAGFNTERTELVSFIRKNKIDNLCMLSGDAHMLTYKASEQDGEKHPWDWGGFPIFHTASIGSPASVKGNGYTVKPKKGSWQWGAFSVSYPDSAHVELGFIGRNLRHILPQAKDAPNAFTDRGQFFQIQNAQSDGKVMHYRFRRKI
jgi:phosphodiesterase/alkaline phosphatase D-like protein